MKEQPENHDVVHLPFRPPYHWKGMLEFLAARAIPGVEAVAVNGYSRSISCEGMDGCFEVSLDEDKSSLAVRVRFGNPRLLSLIIERVRLMFDLSVDWTAIESNLSSDPTLAQLIEAEPGLRVPGCWNGFELAIRAILGQQISVKGASTLAGRIAKNFGRPFAAMSGLTHIFPAPAVLAEANLAGLGLTSARAATIKALARAVRDGQICFDRSVELGIFQEQFCRIPGIGKWTAQYVVMRAFNEPDAFPSSDLGLMRALSLSDVRELERRAETWRPWRAYAAMYLWRSLSKLKANSKEALHKKRKALGQSKPKHIHPAIG